MESEIKPSLNGTECPCNGQHEDIECCCDECDYFLECFPEYERKDED